MNVTKVKQLYGWHMGASPKCCYNGCLGAKLRIGVCQQTISKESSGVTLTLRNGQPLTGNAEGE